MDRIHIALFTPGYPHVDAVLRAVELSRRPGASFSRSLGWPVPPHRDQFVHWLLDTDATHALLLEGDVVPPPDVLDRLEADVPAVTAAYPQWVDDRLAANVQAVADQTWSDTIPAKLFPIRRCLLGCVLVRREVFTSVPSPWFLATMAATRFVDDDEWFCGAVRQAGLRLLCDGRVMCTSFRQGSDLLALTGGGIRRP